MPKGKRGFQPGPENARWVGGRRQRADGYIEVYLPKHHLAHSTGYVLEHRLVMETSLDRELIKGETIHHCNGDRADNRIENLKLHHTQGTHMTHHWEERRLKDEKRQEAIILYQQGLSAKQIGEQMGYKPATVNGWLRIAGVTRSLAEAQQLRRDREHQEVK